LKLAATCILEFNFKGLLYSQKIVIGDQIKTEHAGTVFRKETP
jgi:hypothetical protein